MAPTANQSSSNFSDGALHPLVERLTRLDSRGHWVVSCYLKLEPRDRARGKYLIKVKNRIRERLADLERKGVDRAARDTVARDLERIREHLEYPGNLPNTQGLAVFAAEPLGLFESVPLPQVFRSRLAVDHSPLIRELAAVADEFGTVLCALFDRTAARLFRVTAFDVVELPGQAAGETTRAGKFHGDGVSAGPGKGFAAIGEHNFHQRIRVEKERHLAGVAQRLFELSRTLPMRGIVTGGVGREAGAIEPHLHPYLRQMVLGTVRLSPKAATAAAVMDAVHEALRKQERQGEIDLVRELKEGLGSGWAVNGVEASLRALVHGQVRTLLVNPTLTMAGFRCGESGRLTLASNGCRGEGAGEAVDDLADEAIEEALRQRSQIDVIEDQAAGAKIDGLAALLRFKRR